MPVGKVLEVLECFLELHEIILIQNWNLFGVRNKLFVFRIRLVFGIAVVVAVAAATAGRSCVPPGHDR